MRLDFNVLWVDDQPLRVQAQILAIKQRMADYGFEFCATQCERIEDVKAKVSDEVFDDEVDLILVDWDLGKGVKGQDAITEIRGRVRYKEVIFYSAQNSASALRKLVYENELEGIYCASREELIDEVMGVFESLVKKVLDIDHTRGIVMGATSDIDFMARDCLAAIHEKLDEDGKNKLVEDALERIDKSAKEYLYKAQKLRQAASMPEILQAHMIFTAYDGLRMLCRFLKGCAGNATFEACAPHRPAVVSYMQDVVPHRNKLGHRILVPKGSPLSEEAESGDSISLEDMRKLRCVLLELRTQFRSLHQILRPAP